jgi:hypothetical protein
VNSSVGANFEVQIKNGVSSNFSVGSKICLKTALRYEEGWLAALDELSSYASREDCPMPLRMVGVTASGYKDGFINV